MAAATETKSDIFHRISHDGGEIEEIYRHILLDYQGGIAAGQQGKMGRQAEIGQINKPQKIAAREVPAENGCCYFVSHWSNGSSPNESKDFDSGSSSLLF